MRTTDHEPMQCEQQTMIFLVFLFLYVSNCQKVCFTFYPILFYENSNLKVGKLFHSFRVFFIFTSTPFCDIVPLVATPFKVKMLTSLRFGRGNLIWIWVLCAVINHGVVFLNVFERSVIAMVIGEINDYILLRFKSSFRLQPSFWAIKLQGYVVVVTII